MNKNCDFKSRIRKIDSLESFYSKFKMADLNQKRAKYKLNSLNISSYHNFYSHIHKTKQKSSKTFFTRLCLLMVTKNRIYHPSFMGRGEGHLKMMQIDRYTTT